MASGTIQMTSSKAWAGKIEWSSTQDVANNCSTVTAKVYTRKTDGYVTSDGSYFTGSLTVGSGSESISYQQEETSYTLRATYTKTVYHDSNGSGSVTISASVYKNGGTSLGGYTLSGSKTVSLGTISRASTITANSNTVQMGKKLILNISRADSSFYHTLKYTVPGGSWTVFAENVGSSYSWTVPDLSESCDGYTSADLYILAYTYTSDGTYIGFNYLTGAYTNSTGAGYVKATVPDPTTPAISGNTVTLGTGKTISCPRNGSNFTIKLEFTIGSSTETIVNSKVSSYTWAPSYDLAKQFRNLTQATGTLKCTTYNGSAKVGEQSITVNVICPENDTTKPSFTLEGLSLSVVTELTGDLAQLYILGRTGLRAAFTAASEYSTVAGYEISAGAARATGNPAKIDVLVDAGQVTVTATVTDARGFTRNVRTTIDVLPYSKPKVTPYTGYSAVICERSKLNGELSPTGTYLAIKAGRSYSSFVVDGEERNACTLRYRVKVSGGDWADNWNTLIGPGSADTEISAIISGLTLSTSASYDVQVEAIDSLGGSHTIDFPIMTERISFVLYDGEDGAGFGKYPEQPHVVDIASHMTLLVRGRLVVLGGDWISLALASGVYESAYAYGHTEDCKYLIANGNHVYVSFNCAFTHSGTPITVNSAAIPEEYRPEQTVCSLCPVNGEGIAMAAVNPNGFITVEWVHRDAETGSHNVLWIDGYLDYWT